MVTILQHFFEWKWIKWITSGNSADYHSIKVSIQELRKRFGTEQEEMPHTILVLGFMIGGILSPMPSLTGLAEEPAGSAWTEAVAFSCRATNLIQKQELRTPRFQTLWGCVRSQVLHVLNFRFRAFIQQIWSKRPLCHDRAKLRQIDSIAEERLEKIITFGAQPLF